MKALFNVPPRCLYETFTSSEKMTWLGTGRAAVVDFRVGGRFRWFANSVSGSFLEIEPNRRLKLNMKFADPPVPINVVITFEGTDTTLITVEPENPAELTKPREFEAFWERQFFDIWHKVMGYGRDKIDQ